MSRYIAITASAMLASTQALAQTPFVPPVIASDGSVQIPAYELPFSIYASPEARAAFAKRSTLAASSLNSNASMADIRALVDHAYLPILERQKQRYAVDIKDETIGGVFTQVVTPKSGVSPENRNRVLINLHGGGFYSGARTLSLIESIPIAAVGQIKVISVDYRLAPEYKFPAASEDVAQVYTELLKSHSPSQIGIYGCSAGGTLAGESIAWFQKVGLPIPAAVGIFCAGTHRPVEGDSAYTTPRAGGIVPPPGHRGFMEGPNNYFAHAEINDPLAAPSQSSEVLAKFPPTLFITGTRAHDMSAAVRSQIDLTKAGVDARISIWDGMDHAFHYDSDLPESREVYKIVADFFIQEMRRSDQEQGKK